MKIPVEILRQMVDQARESAPIEACGIPAGGQGKVKKLCEMTNADNRDHRFMRAPKEQFAVAKDICLALTADVTYVMVSVKDDNCPVAKRFLMGNGNEGEVPVKLESTID